MRIVVEKAGGRRVDIAFPSRLILNSLTAALAAPILSRRAGARIPISAAAKMAREINRMRRRHPDWYLVEADSADGDKVRIKL